MEVTHLVFYHTLLGNRTSNIFRQRNYCSESTEVNLLLFSVLPLCRMVFLSLLSPPPFESFKSKLLKEVYCKYILQIEILPSKNYLTRSFRSLFRSLLPIFNVKNKGGENHSCYCTLYCSCIRNFLT